MTVPKTRRFLCALLAVSMSSAVEFVCAQTAVDVTVETVGMYPSGISSDGRVVVGQRVVDGSSEAYMWSRERGGVGLGDLPGGAVWSVAHAASEDGLCRWPGRRRR